MNINIKEIQEQEPKSIVENNIYKYPSCGLPKLTIGFSESSNSTRFESNSCKNVKRVSFNNNVTVVNIQSHKKYLRTQNNQKFPSVFEEDFKDENKQKCVNCEIF